MKKIINLIFISFLLSSANIKAQISSSIVATIGNEIITTIDVENEIRTMLLLSNKKINQSNINMIKGTAIKSLQTKLIKKSELIKYSIDSYSRNDLEKQISRIAKGLNTNKQGLKKLFLESKTNFDELEKKIKVDLQWNTLIYELYKDQISINIVDLENDLKKQLRIEGNRKSFDLSEIEVPLQSENILKFLNNIYKEIDLEGFKETAKKYSISETSVNGGNIGWEEEKKLSKVYLEQLRNLDKNSITKPIKTENSIIILKVNNIRLVENQDVDLEEMKERIIKMKKEEKLNLFSRSHFSNIENSTLIDFK